MYVYIYVFLYAYMYTHAHAHARTQTNTILNEQALVCLSNRKLVNASRGRPLHYKMANNRSITVFSLMCLA